ncbi:MAG: ATPase [Gammaproteobacteria bacterium]|nr:MAG: ATPase [Gammaproteobacteria bacterium]
MKKTMLSWSSGKDSAWTLHVMRQDPDIAIDGLFSTINQEFDRVSMHAVRVALLQQQSDSIGLPIQLIPIPYPCSDADYAKIMSGFVKREIERGVECFAFGDLYLEDIREYREKSLSGSGIGPIFPIWGSDTRVLSATMLESGLRAQITCVDPSQLAPEFCGREYDASFLRDLPPDVDPCGEKGEFHSFAFDGPMFGHEINIKIGETTTRDKFVFTDLLPA